MMSRPCRARWRMIFFVGSVILKKGELSGRKTGLLYFRNRLYGNIFQHVAFLTDNRHDTCFRNVKLLPGQNSQRIVKTKTLNFRPVIIPPQKILVTQLYKCLVSSFCHSLLLFHGKFTLLGILIKQKTPPESPGSVFFCSHIEQNHIVSSSVSSLPGTKGSIRVTTRLWTFTRPLPSQTWHLEATTLPLRSGKNTRPLPSHFLHAITCGAISFLTSIPYKRQKEGSTRRHTPFVSRRWK
nr:MAG TPA: hypothetical protein [Caudoviricetes sp.]